MISVASITDKIIIQQTLLSKHKKTLEWLSSAVLWKQELAFFQKLLDAYAPNFKSVEEKQKLDHFQNIILYYRGELIDKLASQLRLHEKKLAEMLETRDETQVSYYQEHDDLMAQLDSLNTQMVQYKEEFFSFLGKVL
jgi:DNA primase large subunit